MQDTVLVRAGAVLSPMYKTAGQSIAKKNLFSQTRETASDPLWTSRVLDVPLHL